MVMGEGRKASSRSRPGAAVHSRTPQTAGGGGGTEAECFWGGWVGGLGVDGTG